MPDFRLIPSIDVLRQQPGIQALESRFGTDATIRALRSAAAEVRSAIAAGDSSLKSAGIVAARIESHTEAELHRAFRPSLQPVINATGVIVHTNLGRAPLAGAALERMAAVARGYSSLEYDIERGARGRRDVHAEALLCRLTRAQSAVVVNNNAAATLLVLAALAAGREVIVSRGELVEIGGGFRVPDVMAQSGAALREVGTTNKTRAADYAAAITDRTALILRVHPSNFRIEGFTERPTLTEVVAVGAKFKIPVVEDLGSGNLGREAKTTPAIDLQDPAVCDSIDAGVDVCCFSGDKLLGGPQAGIVVGRTGAIDHIRRHPLMRALRVDKLTYAALEATLFEYAAGRATASIPVQRMLALTEDEIRTRARTVAAEIARIDGWRTELRSGVSAVGGGSAPGVELPTCLVAIERRGLTADALEQRLRHLTPPIIARIEEDRVLLDLRTVMPGEEAQLPGLLGQI